MDVRAAIFFIALAFLCGIAVGLYIQAALTVRAYRRMQAEHNQAMGELEGLLGELGPAREGLMQ